MRAQKHLRPAYELVYALLDEDDLLRDAFDVADAAHDGQTRRTPTGRVPYLLHPLWVFFRLRAWGVTDRVALASALLHDSVEDGPLRVIQVATSPFRNYSSRGEGRRSHPAEDAPLTECALWSIWFRFGEDVERVVRGLTNDPDVPYIEHVAEATEDPRVLIVKIADYWHNGLNLDESLPGYDRLSVKYAPMPGLLAKRLRESRGAQALLPAWREVLAVLEARA
jgi:(p)ppGpp synthase/HD superfamily hydrolase